MALRMRLDRTAKRLDGAAQESNLHPKVDNLQDTYGGFRRGGTGEGNSAKQERPIHLAIAHEGVRGDVRRDGP